MAKTGKQHKERPTPEAYLAGFPAKVRVVAESLRKLIKKTVPQVSEGVYPGWSLIGYRVKAGKKNAYFGFIAPFPDRAVLGFEYGILLDDPDRLLEGDGKQVRQVTVRTIEEADATGLEALIRQAARLAQTPKAERDALIDARQGHI